jgi:hypothetical protein
MTVPTFPTPGSRVDCLVTDPLTGAARWRTDYAGVVWYGHPPPTATTTAPPARLATLDGGFFLPDGHAYRRDGVAFLRDVGTFDKWLYDRISLKFAAEIREYEDAAKVFNQEHDRVFG